MAIAVVGTSFVDIKGFPHGAYIPAGRNAGRVEFIHGGVGRNVAEDLANLDLYPVYVSMVDDSAIGADVLGRLRQQRVNTDYVITTKDGLGEWLAVFDQSGDVVGSISKRPDMRPLADLVEEKGDEIFRDADSIVVEIDIDKDIVTSIFKYAAKYGKRVYALVANMSIAIERREFLQDTDCFVCNEQEAGILFLDDFSALSPEELSELLLEKITNANIPAMVVTVGSRGAVYASVNGEHGVCSVSPVKVRDTTGSGDAFCAGLSAALTYGKSLREAVEIGNRLATSVITINENVCPRFLPQELGIEVK